MSAADEMRDALVRGDVDACMRIGATLNPHLPRPANREQGEIVMHRARTETASLPLQARAWSHRWLVERGLPSGLPDALRPKAERMYPVVAEAVGIAVMASSPLLKPLIAPVRAAMEDAVNEAYADGRRDPVFVAARMKEAKARTIRALMG